MKQYLIFLVVAMVMFGCSKSNNKVDCHSGFSLYTVTADEVQNLSSAATVYSQDPSPSNCENYKNALGTYVDALEKYETCALEFGYTNDWKKSIREAREGIKQLQCQ